MGNFSFSDFKNYMSQDKSYKTFFDIKIKEDDTEHEYVGKKATAKVSINKLNEKIKADNEMEVLAEEFKKDGGVVKSVNGKRVNIETTSGEFSLPMFCVKVCKD